jgi:guanosine-3',5'-bis(diphosphate) 3'-pyrophosphohydrolase
MDVMIAAHNTNNFNLEIAVQVSLLHDTLEDTDTTPEELTTIFGEDVRQGIQALTKDNLLPKEQQMDDSLRRIRNLPKEIWAVKLADRITNLQEPPSQWDNSKKVNYQEEARTILSKLQEGNEFLARRLLCKIEEYRRYV